MEIKGLRIGRPVNVFDDTGYLKFAGVISNINKEYNYASITTNKGSKFLISFKDYGIGWEFDEMAEVVQSIVDRAIDYNKKLEVKKVKPTQRYTKKEVDSFMAYPDLLVDLALQTKDINWLNELTGGINNG